MHLDISLKVLEQQTFSKILKRTLMLRVQSFHGGYAEEASEGIKEHYTRGCECCKKLRK